VGSEEKVKIFNFVVVVRIVDERKERERKYERTERGWVEIVDKNFPKF
jgi:hypothetical protein